MTQKTVCISLPPDPESEIGAIFETKWDITNARVFMYHLDTMTESLNEVFSLEYYAVKNTVYACFTGSEAAIRYISNGVYSISANAEIKEINDYTKSVNDKTLCSSADMTFVLPELFPMQNFDDFADNPLALVFSALSNLPSTDRGLVQVICLPLKNTTELHFKMRLYRYWMTYMRYSSLSLMLRIKFTKDLKKYKKSDSNFHGIHREFLDTKKKANSKLCSITLRVSSLAQVGANETPEAVQKRLDFNVKTICDTYKSFNTVGIGNKLRTIFPFLTGVDAIKRMQERKLEKPMKMATYEVVTLWHPPTLDVLPNTSKVLSIKVPHPKSLPMTVGDSQISFFGLTNYRSQFHPFGIKRFDRRNHFYILGRVGTGKRLLLKHLINADLKSGFGCALFDADGDVFEYVRANIPENRKKDLIIFDPFLSTGEFIFNPFEISDLSQSNTAVIGIVNSFKEAFKDNWSVKIESVIRNAAKILVAVKGISLKTFRDFLVKEDLREKALAKVDNEAARYFWLKEFKMDQETFVDQAITPIVQLIDKLVTTNEIRNLLFASKSSDTVRTQLNFRDIIDNRKIILFKLSKESFGSEKVSLLGSLLLNKFFEAATSRANIPIESRADFYIYLDEFHNFTSDSFPEMVSEFRKFRVNLTLTNQYLGQLTKKSEDTVFGNVGSFLSFAVGQNDAGKVSNELERVVSDEDITNLADKEFYAKLTVDGMVQKPFSGRVMEL